MNRNSLCKTRYTHFSIGAKIDLNLGPSQLLPMSPTLFFSRLGKGTFRRPEAAPGSFGQPKASPIYMSGHYKSWGGLWPSKSCIFLTENVSDKSLNKFCLALIPLSPSSGIIISFCVSKGDYKLLATFQRCFRGPSEPLVIL